MTLAIHALVTVVLVRLWLLALSDLWSALQPARRRRNPAVEAIDNLLILIPAHNEEEVLPACLDSVGAALRDHEESRCIVLADNCTDRTAHTAAVAGFSVLERSDHAEPGKPAAIGWALQRIDLRDIDAVVIVDADTTLAPGFLTSLLSAGPWRHRAGQARQRLANRDTNNLTRLAALYADLKFGITFQLKARAALNCPLTGSGSIFGIDTLSRLDWPRLSIAEDLEGYVVLTTAGVRIDYVPDATVLAWEEATLRGSARQRRRWSAGRTLALIRRSAALLRCDRIDCHQKLDAMGELAAPGPVEHLTLTMAGIAVLAWVQSPWSTLLSLLLLLSLARLSLYAALMLPQQPRAWRTAAAFVFLPAYALWRIVVSIGTLPLLVIGRWERTFRHTNRNPA